MSDAPPIRCSIVMSTYGRPALLARTLASIARQQAPFAFECIVVDDGSADGDAIREIVQGAGFGYFRIDREPGYRNPGPARNVGYRIACGDIIIAQSDDVIHWSENTIEKLVELTRDDNFVIATVENREIDADGQPIPSAGGVRDIYTGRKKRTPFFFLGAVQRRHIYAIGGNDEEFTRPGYDDNFFADCLIHGQKLTPIFTDEVVGIHQAHDRPRLVRSYKAMKAVYERKFAYAHASGKWEASGGPWPMDRRTV